MSWIALVLSISGIILNALKKRECWIIWILSNVFWIIHFAADFKTQSAAIFLNVVFMGANFFGLYMWSKKPS